MPGTRSPQYVLYTIGYLVVELNTQVPLCSVSTNDCNDEGAQITNGYNRDQTWISGMCNHVRRYNSYHRITPPTMK